MRTREATIEAITRYFSRDAPADHTIRLAIAHAEAASAVDAVMDVVERIRPNATAELVGRIGPRLVRKIGSPCIALAWLAE